MNIILQLTTNCNLSCDHCFQRFSFVEHSFDLKKWKRYIDFVSKDYPPQELFFTLTGGELMTLDVLSVENILREIIPHTNHPISIQTNFTLMDDTWLEMFSRYEVNFLISYDFNNRYFPIEKINKYKNLVNFKNLHVTIIKGLTKERINQFFLMPFLYEIGLENIAFEVYRPISKEDFDTNSLSIEKTREILEYIKNVFHPLTPFDINFWRRDVRLYTCHGNNCLDIRMTVTPSGKTYTCNYSTAFKDLYIYDIEKMTINIPVVHSMEEFVNKGCYHCAQALGADEDIYLPLLKELKGTKR